MAKKNTWKTKAAAKVALAAGLDALRTGGEKILTGAMDLAPIETGTLRRSGTVTTGGLPDHQAVFEASKAGIDHKNAYPIPIGQEKAVYVSYSTPYARRMHEDMGYTAKIAGGPKYLEKSFLKLRKTILKLAELRMKKALKDAE